VSEASAAIVGGLVYVPGGRLASGLVTSTVEIYDPGRDSWEQGAPLPQPLSAYALAAFEGQLYLFGGWDGTAYRAEVWVYDPGQDTWTTLEPMPTARGRAGVAVTSNRIYVIGGTDGETLLTENEAFDPNTGAWLEQAALPVGRADMGMTVIADNIYLIGGEGEAGPSLTLQYSPTQDVWQAFEPPPGVSRWVQPGLAALNGQSLFVFGGQQDGQLTAQALNYQVLYYLVVPIIK
jgi:N-acetylneuraminic acid mutarotase